MNERTAASGALDALYAELAKTTGVTNKQLRAWTAKTRFESEYLSMVGRRVSCAAVAALCDPLIRKVGELPEEGLLQHAYEALSAGLYPYSGAPRANKGQKSALKVFLTVLSRLMDRSVSGILTRCWTIFRPRRRSWRLARSRNNACSLARR